MINYCLDKILLLAEAFDNPQESLKYIHVTGTNGKGSVCAMLSSILIAAGNKVGRFTSPHLVHPRDSICIDDDPLSSDDYERVCSKILDTKIPCSQFEILTTAAILSFVEKKCDIAVIEVGMGGLLDATNILGRNVPENLQCAVITNVSSEHVEWLGPTVGDIARHKCGILRPNRPVVIGPRLRESAVPTLAKKISCPIYNAADDVIGYECPFGGKYQEENLQIVLAAAKCLNMSRETINTGLGKAFWPGRFHRIPSLNLIVDGAHNLDGASALMQSLAGNAPIRWIIAITKGKDYKAMLGTLLRPKDSVFFTAFTAPAGMAWIEPMDPKTLAEFASSICQASHISNMSPLLLEKRELTVLCGSLYLVSDFYRSHSHFMKSF